MNLIIGESPPIKRIKELIKQVINTDLNVLICGESGVGKDIVARTLHENSSNRKNGLLVKVNCAALPGELLESELFGYEKGAFTGANQTKPGKFEVADGGTIFLDEIGDMPLPLQAKLLQVLQDNKFTRVGGIRDITVNTWVISATNHDLEQDIEAGTFREDLYYRLNIIKIVVPPLRERMEDIPLLIDHFIKKHRHCLKTQNFKIPDEIMRLFETYSWPGNVRELENYVRRLMVVGDVEALAQELATKIQNQRENAKKRSQKTEQISLPSTEKLIKEILSKYDIRNPDTLPPLKKISKEVASKAEQIVIKEVLEQLKWNKKLAAKKLQISYKALLYKIKEYGIKDDLEDF